MQKGRQKGIYVYPGMYVSCETYCETYGINTALDLDELDLESHERVELEAYLSGIVHIQVEPDYNATDGKGVYVHLYSREAMSGVSEIDAELALVRIENRMLYWYENENGEHIGFSSDDVMTGKVVNQLYKFLLEQFSEADIEIDPRLQPSGHSPAMAMI